MSLSAVIFSFDRAAQLEMLLRSLREKAPEFSDFSLSVLFKASHPEFAAGYDEVAAANPEVHFVQEADACDAPLQQQILRLIDRAPRDRFAFFVDDDVILRPFSTRDPEFQRLDDPSILALSLRLHRLVWYCQPMGVVSRPPIMFGRDHTWFLGRHAIMGSTWLHRRWRRLTRFPRGDWSCRFSLDGNVYDTQRFREHFASFDGFDHVTEIEPKMSDQPGWGERLTCYARPRLVNLAMNRVDPHHQYPCAEVSTEEMNARFRAGFRLDYAHLEGRRFRTCHLAHQPVWS